MEENLKTLNCCDSDCAIVNGCQVGGYQCARCGEWLCKHELNEDNLCVDCTEAEAEENKEGDDEWY